MSAEHVKTLANTLAFVPIVEIAHLENRSVASRTPASTHVDVRLPAHQNLSPVEHVPEEPADQTREHLTPAFETPEV